MRRFEIRKEKEKAGESSPSWTYRAKDLEDAAKRHLKYVYGSSLARYPDFWSVMSLEPVGKASRIDGRQLFELKLRTNRPGQINAWEVDRFYVRLIPLEDGDVETVEIAAPSPPASQAQRRECRE